MHNAVLVVHAVHRGRERVAVYSEVGVGLVFEDGYAVSLGYFDHALATLGAEGYAHRVLIDADGIYELWLDTL